MGYGSKRKIEGVFIMKLLKEICRGSLIGVANIMPGVSGGTLAIAMGIYDKIIYGVTHIRKDFKESMRILLPIGVGAVLGFVGLSYVIQWMFSSYPVQTNLLFIGLVLGGVPEILKPIRKEPVGIVSICVFLVLFLLIATVPFLGQGAGKSVVLDISISMAFQLFGIGVLAAATMVVPGVSGSMILLLLGYYEPLLNEITKFIDGFLRLDLQGIFYGIVLLGPMAAGLAVGIFLIANIIEYLFVHYRGSTYWGILGLILASPIGIFAGIQGMEVNFQGWITGIMAFGVGIFIAKHLGEKES